MLQGSELDVHLIVKVKNNEIAQVAVYVKLQLFHLLICKRPWSLGTKENTFNLEVPSYTHLC